MPPARRTVFTPITASRPVSMITPADSSARTDSRLSPSTTRRSVCANPHRSSATASAWHRERVPLRSRAISRSAGSAAAPVRTTGPDGQPVVSLAAAPARGSVSILRAISRAVSWQAFCMSESPRASKLTCFFISSRRWWLRVAPHGVLSHWR